MKDNIVIICTILLMMACIGLVLTAVKFVYDFIF
jgi:hypothetical protein